MFTQQDIREMKRQGLELIACHEMHISRMPDCYFLARNGRIMDCFEAYIDRNEEIIYKRTSTLDLFTDNLDRMLERLAEGHWKFVWA